MGVVYAAYDPELDRKIALKVLRSTSASAGTAGHVRLLREAQALAKFTHPNIVTVHDVGEHEGRVWIAMEFVQGRTLGAWAASGRGWSEVLRVMLDAGAGVAAAHASGVVHRDLKPDNIMVGDDGRVRVMDFGLTRALGSSLPEPVASEHAPAPTLDSLATPVTRHGSLLGTPAYMSPEQFAGLTVGAAADQFSYCVTLWELLFGARPLQGKNAIALGAVQECPGIRGWL